MYALYRDRLLVIFTMVVSCIISWSLSVWIIVMELRTLTGMKWVHFARRLGGTDRMTMQNTNYSAVNSHYRGTSVPRYASTPFLHLYYSIHRFRRGPVLAGASQAFDSSQSSVFTSLPWSIRTGKRKSARHERASERAHLSRASLICVDGGV